jgi:short-chain fatty acids transporter
VPGCDFGFLVAGAYSGFVIWGSGLSSSIALVSATEGSAMNFIARFTGRPATPLSETLLAPYNLILVAASLVLMPLLFRAMMPRGSQIRVLDSSLLVEPENNGLRVLPTRATPAERLEHSRWVLYSLVLLGAAFLTHHFYQNGFDLNLNVVILFFLALGMLLHGRPVSYVRAFNQAARMAGPSPRATVARPCTRGSSRSLFLCPA